MNRALLSAALLAGVLGVFACSSTESYWVEDEEEEEETRRGSPDAGFDSQPSPDSGLGVLQFRPERAYSGFDGEHAFRVPIAVYDADDDLTVTATDPSAVEIVPKTLAARPGDDGVTDNGKYFFVTVKKAGTITLQATSRGKTAEAKIEVAEYAPSRWARGETRYNNTGSGGQQACASCHAGGQAIDHSPAALATVTDEQVSAVITSGISTAGFPISVGHRWTVTADELDGLVTYLRALEPRGFE